MSKKKKKKNIDPVLAKARNLRKSLLSRIRGKDPDGKLKKTTPTIPELYNWLNRKKYVCYYSKILIDFKDINVDHKQPLQRGGNNTFDNLCICSRSMNSIKGTMTEKEFKSLLRLVSKWEDKGESLFRRIKMGHFGR